MKHYAVLFEGIAPVTQVVSVDAPDNVAIDSEEFKKLARSKLSAAGWNCDDPNDVGDVDLSEALQVFANRPSVEPV